MNSGSFGWRLGLRKCAGDFMKTRPIFYVMHALHKKWVEGFVLSFALVFAFIFENNCFIKVMRMFGDQVFGLRCAVFLLLFAFAENPGNGA
ncbi:hypothetical protein BPLS_P3002 [Bathymodiolus platifrons methanotrophic gill symbiont]|uniref:hypothetical protein n=1 Tax=Bathymodiolus platifrons methanotrophic gill symbiont TaxID=113268 RepID=UPI000B40B99E|nr:hypothetical protein [Bathymodiolus platifrons methanotrophic gill symbiont]MCK5869755.1 hypothetical protein [Methyloprofundus sp.]TXK94348.1 hypothetical protein BMR10_13435 [Methylococcaceae bacterium CS4]TXK98536.1 hypothetical protein BMR11_08210 [Methylococcaceae bacterium CS5]TXL04362.1 hypothetical protein BMR07_12675 [Methylococcaceae bacterium CS1]TXL10726.1 hypothetical protein BMR08_07685 [Methylococcaceae bacterium CS2]